MIGLVDQLRGRELARADFAAVEAKNEDRIDTRSFADTVAGAVNEPSAPFFGAFKARSPHAVVIGLCCVEKPSILFGQDTLLNTSLPGHLSTRSFPTFWSAPAEEGGTYSRINLAGSLTRWSHGLLVAKSHLARQNEVRFRIAEGHC